MSNKQEPRLVVTSPGFDDMGEVLSNLGYKCRAAPTKRKSLRKALQKCDALFVNCTGEDVDDVSAEVADYVRRGGTVFASDWAYDVLVDLAIPSLEFSKDHTTAQQLDAELNDSEFRGVLNCSSVTLNFDLPSWAYATRIPAGTRVLMRGAVASLPQDGSVPLAFMLRHGMGTVCFTSFHNHAQTTELEQTLLSLLVLVPVANATQTSITRLAARHGLITRSLGK
jgi:hypothetical protein